MKRGMIEKDVPHLRETMLLNPLKFLTPRPHFEETKTEIAPFEMRDIE
jgi:hypothetical protein